MRWPSPFRELPNPREVWAWGMYDLANQSFTLLVNTLLFSVFFKEFLLGNRDGSNALWSGMVSVSMLLVVLIGPILGVWADAQARKKAVLLLSALVCVVSTAGLALLPDQAQTGPWLTLIIAGIVYIPANLAFNIGENFLASFLPEIASRSTIGRVSAIGWTMGYMGALVLLVCSAAAILIFGLEDPASWRPLLFFAAIWFAVMAIPTALFLTERAEPREHQRERGILTHALGRTFRALKDTREFVDLRILLIAFLVYAFGVQTVVFFAGIITRDDFGFSTTQLVIFILQLTITAGVGSVSAGAVQDRIGHVNTILVYLAIWVFTTLGLTVIAHLRACAHDPSTFPSWPVWIVGNGVGLGIGGIGTATRACVGLFTPCHRSAEFFALWGLAYKLAGATGPLIFGVVRDVAGGVASLTALACFFVLGAALLAPVRQSRGRDCAENAERRAGITPTLDPATVPKPRVPDHL